MKRKLKRAQAKIETPEQREQRKQRWLRREKVLELLDNKRESMKRRPRPSEQMAADVANLLRGDQEDFDDGLELIRTMRKVGLYDKQFIIELGKYLSEEKTAIHADVWTLDEEKTLARLQRFGYYLDVHGLDRLDVDLAHILAEDHSTKPGDAITDLENLGHKKEDISTARFDMRRLRLMRPASKEMRIKLTRQNFRDALRILQEKGKIPKNVDVRQLRLRLVHLGKT
jgi:hypothetical protein